MFSSKEERIAAFKERIKVEPDFCRELFEYATVRLLACKYAYRIPRVGELVRYHNYDYIVLYADMVRVVVLDGVKHTIPDSRLNTMLTEYVCLYNPFLVLDEHKSHL
jgi:hypothetical protein